MYDSHLIVEGKADSGTSGDTGIQGRRGGAIFVDTKSMLRATVTQLPAKKGPIMDLSCFHHHLAKVG